MRKGRDKGSIRDQVYFLGNTFEIEYPSFMARPLRIEYPGAICYLTNRGNDQRPIFSDDQDREAFLDLLYQVNRRYHWLCRNYPSRFG